jgi:hypothetical protein
LFITNDAIIAMVKLIRNRLVMFCFFISVAFKMVNDKIDEGTHLH